MFRQTSRHCAPVRAPLRRPVLPALILAALWPAAHADASGAATTFDPQFFPAGTAPKLDLSRFEKGTYVVPGTYRGDVTLNGQWRARADIVFADDAAGNSQPCFDRELLARYGVDWRKVDANQVNPPSKTAPEERFCGPLGDYVPGATAEYDAGIQALALSVPQIYTQRDARGYVDPSQWDAGVNAATLGYTMNLHRNTIGDAQGLAAYAGLNASLKFGAWHFTHLGSFNWSEHGASAYQHSASYVGHDLPSLRAQLTVGDTFTSGELFDSVRMRGVSLRTDDRMLPQSLRGYAPVVRGVAESNARVSIRQRGYVVYDTQVAPGPFEIDELYPTGYGGDLDVEVTEADGRIKRFSVPFSAVTQLLRPGMSRWSVAFGRIDELDLINEPNMLQATYQRGVSNAFTGYGGAVASSGYRSLLAGGAFNTAVGAFSGDITLARTDVPGLPASEGTSARLGYNKNLPTYGTDFALAAYRYSTGGFYGLNDYARLRDAAARELGRDSVLRERSRTDLSVNQSLGEGYGQLFAIGSVRDYWNSSRQQLDFSAGYSNQWRALSYSVALQRTREQMRTVGGLRDRIPGTPDHSWDTANLQRDTRLNFTVSVPLGRVARAPTMMAMHNRSRQAPSLSQVTVSGIAPNEDRLTYGATLGHTGGRTNLDLAGQYNAPVGNFGAGYSRGSGYEQVSAGLSGGVVVHAGGATLSPPLGETIGLVHAPDAVGARVETGQGAAVDARGYAVVPHLMPYELNTITLDPKGTDVGVELKETDQSVAPRAGSVVLLRYQTQRGLGLMIDTRLPDGRPVPFGARVLDAQGNPVGVAGQASRLFVNGISSSATLTVRWGETPAEACRMHLNIADTAALASTYRQLEVPCVALDAPDDAKAVAMPPRSAASDETPNETSHPSVAAVAREPS